MVGAAKDEWETPTTVAYGAAYVPYTDIFFSEEREKKREEANLRKQEDGMSRNEKKI